MKEEFKELDEVKSAIGEYLTTQNQGAFINALESIYAEKYGEDIDEDLMYDFVDEVSSKTQEVTSNQEKELLADSAFEGIKLGNQTLVDPNFDPNRVFLGRGKNYDINEMRSAIDTIVLGEGKETELIRQNASKLVSFIESPEEKGKGKVDLPLDDFFGGMTNFISKARLEKTYDYWENIAGRLDNPLDEKSVKNTQKAFLKKVNELFEKESFKLKEKEKGATKISEFKRSVKKLEQFDKNIRYVDEVDTGNLSVKSLRRRLMDLTNLFLREFAYLPDKADLREITEAGNFPLDPLTARFVLKNKKVLVTPKELEDMKKLLDKNLSRYTFKEEEFVEIKNDFVNSIEAIESLNRDKYTLPIFIGDELGKFSKNTSATERNVSENISEYLDIVADIFEDTKTVLPFYVEITNIRQESGQIKERGANKEVRSQVGRAGTLRIVEEIEDVMFDFEMAINRYFVEPLRSIYTMGIDIPFAPKVARLGQYFDYSISGQFDSVVERKLTEQGSGFLSKKDFDIINKFFSTLKTRNISYNDAKKATQNLYMILIETIGRAYRNEIKRNLASLLGSIAEVRGDVPKNETFEGINISEAFDTIRVDDPNELFYIKRILDKVYNNRNMFQGINNSDNGYPVDKFAEHYQRIAKRDFNSKLLQAHDSLRILKNKEVVYSFRDIENSNDIIKTVMEFEEDGLHISALDVERIVKSDDAYGNLSSEHGISFDSVYTIKGMFR